jgi:signal transduction histidine kinase
VTASSIAARSPVVRVLDGLWLRFGVGYIALAYTIAAIGALAGTGITLAVVYAYVPGPNMPLEVVLAAEAGVAFGTGLAMMLAVRDLRPLLEWVRGGRPRPTPAPVWETVVRMPRRRVPLGMAFVALATIPAELLAAQKSDFRGWDIVADFTGVQVGIAVFGVWLIFLVESMLRSVLRDVGLETQAVRLERPRTRIGRKVMVGTAVTTAFTALLVGAIGPIGDSVASRLLGEVAVAVAITLTFSAVITTTITDSVEAPVRDLMLGTARVAAGELDHNVPVSTDDEFGVLAVNFNQMVGQLRTRTQELRASRARIVAAADAARRDVERDLHDGAQQRLVMLNIRLGALERKAAEHRELKELAGEARAELTLALSELRDLAHGLYPVVLENDGLERALAEAAERLPLPVGMSVDGAGRYTPALEAAVYFCCLEALQNASKHAGEGARITIKLSDAGRTLSFEVRDDGTGFDISRSGSGTGLHNMRDRIGALGGTVEIESTPGAGTAVIGSVPHA